MHDGLESNARMEEKITKENDENNEEVSMHPQEKTNNNVEKIIEIEKPLSATLKRTSLRYHNNDNYELLIKVEHLNREVLRHLKEKEILKNENIMIKEQNASYEQESIDLKAKLEKLTKDLKEATNINSEMKENLELFMSQKLFYLQEIDIYKNEAASKDLVIEKLKQDMNKLMPSEPNKNKLTWLEVEDLKKNVQELSLKMAQITKEKEIVSQKYERSNEILEEMNKNNEEMANEINYLRKKCESLALEKIIPPFTPKKEDTYESLDGKNNENLSNSLLKIKENIKEKTKESSEDSDKMGNSLNGNKFSYQPVLSGVEEENKKLKEQIKQLEITIETYCLIIF